MVIKDRSSCFLCNRLKHLYDNDYINITEANFVIDYMFLRRPNLHVSTYWWGNAPSTGFKDWLQAKHDWLQKLIDELRPHLI